MATWTNKQWGAVIGALVLFSMYLIGFTQTLVVVLFGIVFGQDENNPAGIVEQVRQAVCTFQSTRHYPYPEL